MLPKKYYFYHYSSEEIQNKDKSTTHVWLPLSVESKKMIEHIGKKSPDAEINIQQALSDFFLSTDQFLKASGSNKSNSKKIILYAQSDTLANSVSVIGKNLQEHSITYVVPKKNTEKADTFFESKKIEYKTYSYSILKSIHPDVFLLLNDWSKEAQRIIAHCHLLKIPVVCLQESVIDFGDHFKRMQHADEVFVQGSQTVIDLKRNSYYITGNPRYENINPVVNKGENVLINCNFTYGIFEDKRESWLDDIHQTLLKENLEYVISQHPRDTGNLSKYKKVISSSSASISQQLEDSNLLITRFSSLIHESLAMGIPVIYYNPHGETMQYDFEFDGKILQLARSRKELEACVLNFKNLTMNPQYLNEYLARHCICRTSLPSKNIEYIISTIPFKPGKFTAKDMLRVVFYHPTIKIILSNIRKVFKLKSA